MWSTGSESCSLSKKSSDSGHCGPVERNNLLLEAAAATLAARKQPPCLSWCSFQTSISASFQSQVRLLEALCIGVANVGTGCILVPLLWEARKQTAEVQMVLNHHSELLSSHLSVRPQAPLYTKVDGITKKKNLFCGQQH